MTCEHLPQEKFPLVAGEGISSEKERFELSDIDDLPISDILRFMTHEKFILSGLIILGIGKLLIILAIFQIV
jgi:hypothetical protein